MRKENTSISEELKEALKAIKLYDDLEKLSQQVSPNDEKLAESYLKKLCDRTRILAGNPKHKHYHHLPTLQKHLQDTGPKLTSNPSTLSFSLKGTGLNYDEITEAMSQIRQPGADPITIGIIAGSIVFTSVLCCGGSDSQAGAAGGATALGVCCASK